MICLKNLRSGNKITYIVHMDGIGVYSNCSEEWYKLVNKKGRVGLMNMLEEISDMLQNGWEAVDAPSNLKQLAESPEL